MAPRTCGNAATTRPISVCYTFIIFCLFTLSNTNPNLESEHMRYCVVTNNIKGTEREKKCKLLSQITFFFFNNVQETICYNLVNRTVKHSSTQEVYWGPPRKSKNKCVSEEILPQFESVLSRNHFRDLTQAWMTVSRWCIVVWRSNACLWHILLTLFTRYC